jgi:hypothetical protein
MNARRLTLSVLAIALGVLALTLDAGPAFAVREYVQGFSFGREVNQTKVHEREEEEAKGEPVTVSEAEENVCTAASGDTCQPGKSGFGKGEFNGRVGVAVNDSTGLVEGAGDVYVVDKGNNRVERFNSTGSYLGQFNGGGAFEVEGKEIKGAAAPTGQFSEPGHIAVDDSGNPLDPSAGDVYVVDTGQKVIDKFSATGEYLAQLTETTGGTLFGSTLNGVAVDPLGNLWVYDETPTESRPEGKIDEFSDTGGFVRSFKTGNSRSFNGGGLAADSNDVYVGEENRVAKFESATGKEVAHFNTRSFAGAGVHDLAVNPSTDNLLLDDNEAGQESPTEVLVYGPGGEPYGTPLQTLLAEPPLSFSYGVAVNGESTVYASERQASDVRAFDYILFPAVSTEPTTVDKTGITLHGGVNPEGEEITECQFEYGTQTGEYPHTLPCSPKAPFSGKETVPVSASPTELEPRTTYHFRLTARAKATKSSRDDTFFTSTRPLVEGQASSNVGSAVATVSAQIDPTGLQTTYRVEYGTSQAYGASTPEVSAGAPIEAASVAAHLSGLNPGTEYHFRFVASNALGTTQGPDATFTTFASAVAASTLPDERVYELVSTSSGPGEVYAPTTYESATEDITTEQLFQAAASGDAVVYMGDPGTTGGNGATGGGEGNEWLATRISESWTTSDITPVGSHAETGYEAFSSDLSTGFIESERQPPLAPDAPAECRVLYSRASGSGTYRALLTTITTPGHCGHPHFAGASADESQIIFQSEAALTENSQEATEVPAGHGGSHGGGGVGQPCEFGCNLYDAVGGRLRLVNVLPKGEADPNATFGGPSDVGHNGADLSNAISMDGSRIFWTDTRSGPDMEHIYVLENGTSNVHVSGVGAAKYWTATPDGRYAFYTEGEKLWRFDTESNTREALAGEGLKGENAGVQGVLGINDTGEDGAYVYFVATGVLVGDENGNKERAEAGQNNLYLRHGGVTSFVATLSPEDNNLKGTGLDNNELYGDWMPNLGNRTAEVTPDGRHLVFESVRPLTGYDNVLAGGGRALEAFAYAADAGRLACASCSPTGAPPPIVVNPSATLLHVSSSDTYIPRWISADGSRVFFDTFQPLVPQDTNGVQDVYEWEREGTPSCPESTPARRDGGCIFLLSNGESSDYSYFVDASANGSDVFLTTRSELVLQDRDGKIDLYDARVDGYRPASPPLCTGTGCQGVPPAQPIFATPSSVTFNGVGNFEPQPKTVQKPPAKSAKCGKRSIRRRSKCVRKKRARRAKRSSRRSKSGSKQ